MEGNLHLVFLETSGNQSYIYATNRLRENVGASELTARAGMHWLMEALGRDDLKPGQPSAFRSALRAQPVCPGGEEIVLATSGKAMVLVPSEARGRELIAKLTTRALREAPGLSLAGALVQLDSRSAKDASKAIKKAHERFDAHRRQMPGAVSRESVLPFQLPCDSSGLPSVAQITGKDKMAVSAPILAKRDHAQHWFNRVKAILGGSGLRQIYSIERMEQDFDSLDWLGVVYSDGNGLGQIMLSFDEWVGEKDYFTALREFSLALDDATEAAFIDAAGLLLTLIEEREPGAREARLPLVPLLLGGDDLTVLVHGRYALPFTRCFLEAFERQSAALPALAEIARPALKAGRLSAAAGVAIVKPHYPYHVAHGLADALLRSAKETKKRVQVAGSPFPCSALDFHVLFDAAQTDLDQIREQRRRAADDARLWGGPYVVTPMDALADAEGRDWAEQHHLDGLLERVNALNARDEDGRFCLPTSQTHALREALSTGKQAADAALKERIRLFDRGLETLLESEHSLFRWDVGGEAFETRFLDAISTAEFWPDRKGEQA